MRQYPDMNRPIPHLTIGEVMSVTITVVMLVLVVVAIVLLFGSHLPK